MEKDELLLADERVELDRLLQTPGWKIMHSKWLKLLNECEARLSAEESVNREWLAGLVTGYKRLLSWPDKRIAAIDKQLTANNLKNISQ